MCDQLHSARQYTHTKNITALFTPFPNLGLIIIDEEHENSYKSESVPRYHAREVAIEYARMNNASVVLGSATPSVDSYYNAKNGKDTRLELNQRVEEKPLPDSWRWLKKAA